MAFPGQGRALGGVSTITVSPVGGEISHTEGDHASISSQLLDLLESSPRLFEDMSDDDSIGCEEVHEADAMETEPVQSSGHFGLDLDLENLDTQVNADRTPPPEQAQVEEGHDNGGSDILIMSSAKTSPSKPSPSHSPKTGAGVESCIVPVREDVIVYKTQVYKMHCTICFDAMEENVSALRCGHMFHHECLKKSAEYSSNRRHRNELDCPQCRTKHKFKDIVKIYVPKPEAVDDNGHSERQKCNGYVSYDELNEYQEKISDLEKEKLKQEQSHKDLNLLNEQLETRLQENAARSKEHKETQETLSLVETQREELEERCRQLEGKVVEHEKAASVQKAHIKRVKCEHKILNKRVKTLDSTVENNTALQRKVAEYEHKLKDLEYFKKYCGPPTKNSKTSSSSWLHGVMSLAEEQRAKVMLVHHAEYEKMRGKLRPLKAQNEQLLADVNNSTLEKTEALARCKVLDADLGSVHSQVEELRQTLRARDRERERGSTCVAREQLQNIGPSQHASTALKDNAEWSRDDDDEAFDDDNDDDDQGDASDLDALEDDPEPPCTKQTLHATTIAPLKLDLRPPLRLPAKPKKHSLMAYDKPRKQRKGVGTKTVKGQRSIAQMFMS